MDALQEVVDKGWTDEAKEHAAGALMALSDHQPDAERAVAPDQRHVMMSYQWDAQEIVQRIVNELQGRGYTLWFDLYQCVFPCPSLIGCSLLSETLVAWQHEGQHG